ncbi:MAG: hypothetical protein ACRENQ_12725 [Gemmatimonadaceae bacterium]
MRGLRRAILAAVCLSPVALFGQESPTRCNALNTPTTRQTSVMTPTGQYDTYVGGGVVVVCPAKDIHLKADSLEQYGDQKRLYLVGHVDYREPRFAVRSDFLNYYMSEERVVATGNVDATMSDSSKLKGPVATYLRPIPTTRPLASLHATGRPTITLIQRDSLGRVEPPMDVTADNVFMKGDSLVYAGGTVQIQRQDLTAHSDSMFLDGQHEILHLIGRPRIEGRKGDNPFTLDGTLIDLYSHDQKLDHVLARGQAVATSKDLTLHADTIEFHLIDAVLQQAQAWGPARAAAKSPTDSLLADSIDVIMPGQRAREIHAVGRAYAESKPDSLRFHTTAMNWMRGDTILAKFDTIPAKDSAQAPRIRQLIAIDSASAYYNMAPQDSTLCVPAMNYSKGSRIVVTFGAKGAEQVDVLGKTVGIFAEPTDSLPENRCAPAAKKSNPKHPPPAGHPDTTATHRPSRPSR